MRSPLMARSSRSTCRSRSCSRPSARYAASVPPAGKPDGPRQGGYRDRRRGRDAPRSARCPRCRPRARRRRGPRGPGRLRPHARPTSTAWPWRVWHPYLADVRRPLARHRGALGRRHDGRRVLEPRAPAPRGRGHRERPVRRRAHRARRERTVAASGPDCSVRRRTAWQGQFELPFGTMGPMTLLTLGTLRFLRDRGLDRRSLAEVVVAQRDWAARTPRALRRDADHRRRGARRAPVIAYPFTTPDVLREHRRRRRGRGHLGRAGPRPPPAAGARARQR